MKCLKRGWLVYVEMDDIEHGSKGWQDFSAIAGQHPRTYRAVGWIIRATKRTLTLSPLTAADSGFCHYLIPRRSITKVRKI